MGDRQATGFFASPGVTEIELADAAQLASIADETPEGPLDCGARKTEIRLARARTCGHEPRIYSIFGANRMSGVDLDGHEIRKGAIDAVTKYAAERGNKVPQEIQEAVATIASSGGTPLLVARNRVVLGTIQLEDIVKGGMRERFDQLRAMGIRTVMITGDNPLTAAAIARQAGVDGFLAEAKPEDKMKLIKDGRQKENSSR